MGDEHMNDEMGSAEASGAAEEAHEGSSTQEVKDAFATVGKGLSRLFSAIGSAIRDPEFQEKAKATGSSVVDAVGETLNTVADQVKDAFQRRGESAEEDGDGADEAMEDAERELDDADAVEEIRADLSEEE